MENALMKIASQQGIWAILAVFLLFYTLRKQDKRDAMQAERESKYQSIIQELSSNLDIVKKIDVSVNEINKKIGL